MSRPRTLLDKIWDAHLVASERDGPDLLYVDVQLLHEVTSPQAFAELERGGWPVRRPDRHFATVDHSIPTCSQQPPSRSAQEQTRALVESCRRHGIRLWGPAEAGQGIVHVIAPEHGLCHPGSVMVCGDSHTCTHGAFGALAFGIGTTQVAQVLATQCLRLRRPGAQRVEILGRLPVGSSAKDLALFLCARLGSGAKGVLELTGEAVRALDLDQRMTLCNMAVEMGARSAIVAPDDVCFEGLRGRDHAPRGADFDAAVRRWRRLRSDEGAVFQREHCFDAAEVEPWLTWGTRPSMGTAMGGRIPDAEAAGADQRQSMDAMGWTPGEPMAGRAVDVVFVGSCTNSRLSDLREVAAVLRGRRVADGVRMLVVPGSREVRRQAEDEGLDAVVREAGAEWREPGCSMCIAMNGDQLQPGQLAVSTSNRNFEGRQGPGGRSILASPRTAAWAAVQGAVPSHHAEEARS